MTGRTTLTTDIRALRVLAAQGFSMAHAARKLGMTHCMVSYWDRREGLGFKRRGKSVASPMTLSAAVASDLAIARLSRTVERVAAASGGERQ